MARAKNKGNTGNRYDYSQPQTVTPVARINRGEIEVAENGMPIKAPGSRPDNLARVKEQTNPGDNARYLRHSLDMWDLPLLDISDPEQVRERIGWYFLHCAENDMKPTVTGLSLALGVTMDTMRNWASGKKERGEHMELIQKARMIIEDQMNAYMENGKINPVAGIFLLKNHFHYKDQQETIITPNMSMGEDVDANEMRMKYIDMVSEDED